jgi:chromosome segregation ATPase
MNVTKYADLSQSLAESEKKLYDKIAEECAGNFQIEIHDSVQQIKRNAESMTEVVDKIRSCKDSYGEAAELVENLSVTLADTQKNVTGLNSELEQISETAGSSAGNLSEKVTELSELSDKLAAQNKENEAAIEEICKNIQKLGEEYSSSMGAVIKNAKNFESEINSAKEQMIECQHNWKISCEENFTDVSEKVDVLLADLEEKRTMISSEIKSMQEYQILIESGVNDVKKSTSEYVETVQESNASLLESFDVFKSDFITAYDKQSQVIEELKEEQLKLKKMYILGILPAIIIIVLQIINIV